MKNEKTLLELRISQFEMLDVLKHNTVRGVLKLAPYLHKNKAFMV